VRASRARWLGAALLSAASLCRADEVTCLVNEAQGLPDAMVRKVQRATEAALKQLSGFTVVEGPAFKKGAPKRCGDDCEAELAHTQPNAVVLDLKADTRTDKLMVSVALWLGGERVGARRAEGTLETPEVTLKPLLEALLPGWARRGWGGLKVDVEALSALKVDGRLVDAQPSALVPVTAGAHQVDVVFADGHAVLQRLEVKEGKSTRLEVSAAAPEVGKALKSGISPVRAVSYAAWVVGAGTLASGILAGALSRNTSAGLVPCTPDTRGCATLDSALDKQRQAQSLADTGNVLIGIGAGLAAVGAGLFVVDVVTAP
jgi:hypothetical protein